jgi:hypothetical protein
LHARKNLGRDLIRFRDPAAGVAYMRQVRDEMEARYSDYENNAIDLDILLVEVELERGLWEDAVADAAHGLDRLREMSLYHGPSRERWVGAAEIRLGYALARLGRLRGGSTLAGAGPTETDGSTGNSEHHDADELENACWKCAMRCSAPPGWAFLMLMASYILPVHTE